MYIANLARQPCPTDIIDVKWSFVAAPQRHHDLREFLDALRWIARTGAHSQTLSNDFP
jgi:transposase